MGKKKNLDKLGQEYLEAKESLEHSRETRTKLVAALFDEVHPLHLEVAK